MGGQRSSLMHAVIDQGRDLQIPTGSSPSMNRAQSSKRAFRLQALAPEARDESVEDPPTLDLELQAALGGSDQIRGGGDRVRVVPP